MTWLPWSQLLPALPAHWRNLTFDKWWLGQMLGITDDGLHVHGGLLVLMLAAWLMKRPPWHWRPWMVVVVLETANEAYDMLQHSFPSTEASLAASSHDWWMTLAWPTIILLVFPRLIRRYAPA